MHYSQNGHVRNRSAAIADLLLDVTVAWQSHDDPLGLLCSKSLTWNKKDDHKKVKEMLSCMLDLSGSLT